MKKNIILSLFASIFVTLNLSAQLTEAEDFTVTDIEGVEHNLFEYLDDGKYVYLNFIFNTCLECEFYVWDLNNVYNSFGCNAHELVLISINSEGNNNWLVENYVEAEGAEYPLVSGAEGGGAAVSQVYVQEFYELEDYPVNILINPDRSLIYDISVIPLDVEAQGPSYSACPGEMPIADFMGDPLIIPAGDSVLFTYLGNEEHVTSWHWEFPGSETEEFDSLNPGWIIYNEPGLYDVILTVSNDFNNTHTVTKQNYVDVKIAADTFPTANFTANQITILVGTTIHFTDLSLENPYYWEWTFDGATPGESYDQHPQNITYNTVGTFDVQLIVMNSYGFDTLLVEDYIKVIPDAGDLAPVVGFTADHRLVKRGTYVNFIDTSANFPTTWTWVFQGAEPNYAYTQIIPGGVKYNSTGYFDVTLSVSNPNGASIRQKKEYIVVYDSFISKVCDTITNMRPGEVPKAYHFPNGSGYYGGHNSDQIRAYADHYNVHTFNTIYGIIIPIIKLQGNSTNPHIRVHVWDGSDPVPTTELLNQRVNYTSLQENFNQIIMFNEALELDGPFYLGYSFNYTSGDQFAVALASNRGTNGFNSLFVRKDDQWFNSKFEYDIATSTAIRPIVCLVGMDDFSIEDYLSIYPNPADQNIYIDYNFYFKEGEFAEIFDMSGRTIKQTMAMPHDNRIVINVSDIPVGTYFVRVFAEGKLFVEKINIMR